MLGFKGGRPWDPSAWVLKTFQLDQKEAAKTLKIRKKARAKLEPASRETKA
jgi:hypothetical protein